jgi:hypothetical protein
LEGWKITVSQTTLYFQHDARSNGTIREQAGQNLDNICRACQAWEGGQSVWSPYGVRQAVVQLQLIHRGQARHHLGLEQLGQKTQHSQQRKDVETIAQKTVLALSLEKCCARDHIEARGGMPIS